MCRVSDRYFHASNAAGTFKIRLVLEKLILCIRRGGTGETMPIDPKDFGNTLNAPLHKYLLVLIRPLISNHLEL